MTTIKTKKLPYLPISDAEKDELVEIYLRAARKKLAREAEALNVAQQKREAVSRSDTPSVA